MSAWLVSLQYSLRKALSTILGVFGRHSCLCPEIPPLSNGPRLIPFGANCCMRCSHCEVDPCFQFVFWLDVYHFVVAVCIVDAFFVLSQNLAVCFVSGSLVIAGCRTLTCVPFCTILIMGWSFLFNSSVIVRVPKPQKRDRVTLAKKSVSLFLGGHLDG